MVRYATPTEFWVEPLATLKRIQEEINRAFGDDYAATEGEFPPMNVWRGEAGMVVTVQIPGVSLDELDLSVHLNSLTIKGRRPADIPPADVNVHRRERVIGPFARTVTLPYNVDSEQVRASAENGILRIDLPRPEQDKPRRIHIGTL
jgi:Molecular chaperone (small heat shock protein)